MFTKLVPGTTIGISSPAWIPLKERVANGIKYLKEKGFNVKISNNINNEYGYFAGTDEERLEDLHDLFADKEVSAILATRGGWGTLRMLHKLDFELIKSNPKPVIGYSDITSLQLAILTKTGLGSLSGPMLAVEMGKGIKEFTANHFWDYVQNSKENYKILLEQTKTSVMKKGKVSGKLLGGCLSMVTHLLGTPFTPDFKNTILFLEDVGEKPYKIDRYFAHLKQAGVFDQINGLILGEFLDCDPENKEEIFTINYLIEEYFSEVEFPVLCNFPYGHGDIKVTMPIGANTIIDTENGELIFENLFNE